MSLDDLAKKHGTDKAGPKHTYTRTVYPKYLDALRDKPIRLLELGIYTGASARMWSEYFTHPDSEIVVADNWDLALKSDVGRAKSVWCDFRMNSAVKDLISYGPFDIVIDDGSHIPITQHSCLVILREALTSNGLYFIEDCQSGSNKSSMDNLQVQVQETYMDYLAPTLKRMVVNGKAPDGWAWIHTYPKVVVYGKES